MIIVDKRNNRDEVLARLPPWISAPLDYSRAAAPALSQERRA